MHTANPTVKLTLAATLLAVAACGSSERPTPPTEADPPSAVERGRYLVSTSGCHDCHTPWAMGPNGPAPDMTRALSGHPEQLVMPPVPELPAGPWIGVTSATNTAHAGPWGVSFSANLTSDDETGLGTWTTQNFIDTIRNARHMGAGRPILPPMPAPVYANLTDEDLAAVFAYLETVPAVKNHVPAPIAPRPTATASK